MPKASSERSASNIVAIGLFSIAAALIGAFASWAMSDFTARRNLEASEKSQAQDLNARLEQWKKENAVSDEGLEELRESNRLAQERFLAEMTAQDQRHQRELDAFARLIELNSQSIAEITGNQDEMFDELSAQVESERLESQKQQTRDRVFAYVRSARMLQSAMATLDGTGCRRIETRSGGVQYSDSDCSTLDAPRRELLTAMADYESAMAIAKATSAADIGVQIDALDELMKLNGLKAELNKRDYGGGTADVNVKKYIVDAPILNAAIDRIENELD